MEQADSVQSPVRRSLERVRVRDLVLGLLLIDEDSALQVTPKQASLLVPMQALLAEVLQRRPGEVGKSSAPLVEAQVRALLTEAQQQKILEVAEARGLAGLDVDQDDMLRQLGTLLVARQTGGSFRFDLQSLASGRPSEMAREGPAVIPQKAELDLQVAIRGILLHLEQQPALRLDSEQVADLALMTPSLQQCLVNLLNRIRDPRIPELQGRVAHLLRPEQVRYIRDHQHDPVAPLDFRPGEEPVAKELGRFIQARSQGLPYRPEVQGSNLPGAAVPFGSPTPGAPPTRPEPGSGGGALAPGPAPVPTPAATRTVTPTPGARPEPVALQPSPGQPGPTPSPTGVEPPLEAMVRGMLFRMEKEPALRLRRSQVERLQERLADFRSVLDAMEAGRRDERGPELVRALEGFLSATQKEFLYAHAQDPPVALQVGRGESPLARELRRFVEARLAGRPYQPLWNLEAPK